MLAWQKETSTVSYRVTEVTPTMVKELIPETIETYRHLDPFVSIVVVPCVAPRPPKKIECAFLICFSLDLTHTFHCRE